MRQWRRLGNEPSSLSRIAGPRSTQARRRGSICYQVSGRHGLAIRLGVMTALRVDGSLDFTTLKRRLDVADGALGLHLGKLEEIGYITATKGFIGRRPKTTYRLTTQGVKALDPYLRTMRQLLDEIDAARLPRLEGRHPAGKEHDWPARRFRRGSERVKRVEELPRLGSNQQPAG